MAYVLGLCAEEPQRGGVICYVEAELRELRCVGDELEVRVDDATLGAWGGEAGLRQGLDGTLIC